MGKLSRSLLPLLFVGCGGFEKTNCYTWGIDCESERVVNNYEDVTHVVVSPEPATIVIREPGTPVPGAIGPRGNSGTSCTVANTTTGATIFCEDGTSATISNGIDGINGSDGESIVGPQGEPGQDAPSTPFTVVELIDPCGQEAAFDEVLLRMADGSLMAHYSAGGNQFLTLVPAGSYATTDGTGCTFTVTSELTVVDEYGNEWSVN